jgi:beta-lactamase regulating signal transducer with metallopeptidase domain
MIPALVEASLRALLVAVAVGAGLRVLRVRNVLAQKAAWGLVLAAALIVPSAMRWQWLSSRAAVVVPAHPWRLAANLRQPGPAASPAFIEVTPLPRAKQSTVPAESAPQASRIITSSAGDSAESVPMNVSAVAPPAMHALAASPTTGFHPLRIATIAALLYVTICGILVLRLFYGLASALCLWLDAEPVAPSLDSSLRVRFSRAVASPVTIGSGVVLPADYDEWDAEKLRIVLAHERSHVRQGDFYLQSLAGLYAALFWFSPLGWWLKRKLCDLGEAISDRAGLQQAASRSSYAQVLLEFAALPRPTVLGVAMARTSNLSHRIDRLLNDSSFRQAFAAGGRRALLAVLLVPAALFAATALIRVEAAATPHPIAAVQEPAQAVTPPAQAPATGQSNPDKASDAVAPAAQVPATPPAPGNPAVPVPPVAPGSTVVPEGAPSTPPPPQPPDNDQDVTVGQGQSLTITNSNTNTNTNTNHQHRGRSTSVGNGYSYSWSDNGDSWAMSNGPSGSVRFSGDWHNSVRADMKKAESLAHGKFIWLSHDGKSYFIDDPAIIADVEAMYKPMEALGAQQAALGKQQEELGRQQEKLGRLQQEARVPTPELSKEIAEINAAVAKLQAKKGSTVGQEELADLEGKLGDLQGKLGEIQGRIGEKEGAFGEQQGKLGELQGKLGEQQGRLGEQQDKIAEEADRKVKSIIDQSLRNGKAHPVE